MLVADKTPRIIPQELQDLQWPGPGIVQDIQAERIGGFNLIIITETKITDQSYFHNKMGYDVVCLQAITTEDGNMQGEVGMVVRYQSQGWIIELTRLHGKNMVRFEVVT